MVTIKWLGHAAFEIACEGKKIYIDPFITGNPNSGVSLDEITEADIVCVTHGHSDHVGDTAEIIKRTGAVLVSVPEIGHYLRKHVPNLVNEALNTGGSIKVKGIKIYATDARHSNAIDTPTGDFPVGASLGFVIECGGKRIYHAGDTALFLDMKLINELYAPDVALLPIGGRFTMGVKEAAIATLYINPKIVIPMHYNTFPLIKQNPQDLKDILRDLGSKAEVKIMSPGESMNI